MQETKHRRSARRTFAVLCVGVAGLAMLAATSGFAQDTDAFIQRADSWETYANGRFGLRLDFPAEVFAAEAAPENGDGRTFKSTDATLQAFAFENVDGDDPASLKRELVGGEGYENVTYSPTGQGWLVLSGFRENTIFYEKYFFRDGVISAFGMEFPADRKPFYAPIVERIEDSFRAGGTD